MSNLLTDTLEQARLTARALVEFGDGLINPTLRLGVTGMSGAGKTVFLTALVNALTAGGRFPVFEALASGRLARARLAPQPDDDIPRFEYERHLRALTDERRWPESTRQISELRLVIDYQSRNRALRTLTLDIVDYPGEWLLDLPLLTTDYDDWSRETLALAQRHPRAAVSAPWRAHLATMDPLAPADELAVVTSAELFTAYLRACRDERYAMSMLPPGRFLMPGDLAGSPALTFAPLALPDGGEAPKGSVWAMMRRRFEAYKSVVVRPFFREHFARLDRQIVVVDALAAFNAGPEALRDLEGALASILACFRVGRRTILGSMFNPKIEKILFAATKADHLHHINHDRLEAIVRRMVMRAAERAEFAGSEVDVIALAAVRATREATVRRDGESLATIVGVPAAGQTLGTETFDGEAEVALFPGDLPADAAALFDQAGKSAFQGLSDTTAQEADYRFLKLRPPKIQRDGDGSVILPHIRLDRALQFLMGDRLQ